MANDNALEPMQLDLNVEPEDLSIDVEDNFNHEANHHHGHCNQRLIVDNAALDLESHANNYKGLARIKRLEFIADHCPPLRVEALKMAINNVMETSNVNLYQCLHQKLISAASGNANNNLPDVAGGCRVASDIAPLDVAWIDAKNKKSAMKLEKLDMDLKNYKSNSIKESIRRGHDDLGDYYLDIGDLSNAVKCYSRARDYCTSAKHIINMCNNVVKVAIYTENWGQVLSFVSKGENAIEGKEYMPIITRFKCSAGLAELVQRNYHTAARYLLQANVDHCDFPEIMSPNNIAIYGGLCALATYTRPELKRLVIHSNSFKLFLELEPQLRDIIYKFYESKYATCLKLLDEMRDNLYLDMYIAPHVANLYSKIRNRALIQYFSPYSSADMTKMAAAFNTSVTELENELMKLILDGQILARIDSHNKILYAKDIDQRRTTFERSIKIGKECVKNSHMLILRAAILKHRIVVKCPEDSRGK